MILSYMELLETRYVNAAEGIVSTMIRRWMGEKK